MPPTTTTVGIRYMIDDVPAAIKFYTTHLGFVLLTMTLAQLSSVSRDGVRLLLSGKASSGRRAMPDGPRPRPRRLEPDSHPGGRSPRSGG